MNSNQMQDEEEMHSAEEGQEEGDVDEDDQEGEDWDGDQLSGIVPLPRNDYLSGHGSQNVGLEKGG